MVLVWTETQSYTCVCCDIGSVADGCSWRTREQNKMSHMHCCRTTECTMSHIVAGPQCTMHKQYDNPTKHNVRDLGLWDFAQSPARCDSDCNWSKVCLSSTHFPTSRLWYQRIQLGYSTVILPRHEFECNSSNYEGRHGAFQLWQKIGMTSIFFIKPRSEDFPKLAISQQGVCKKTKWFWKRENWKGGAVYNSPFFCKRTALAALEGKLSEISVNIKDGKTSSEKLETS